MSNTMFFNLLLNIGLLVLIATMLTKLPMVRSMLLEDSHAMGSRAALAVIFGLVSIFSTYTGVRAQGAIVNTRVIGVLAAGLLGGPYVGIGAAVIGGLHRYLFDIGGFTAVSCAVSTFVEGLIGSAFSKRFKAGKIDGAGVFLITALAEIGQMAIILLISRPFPAALDLVRLIAFPMIIMNALGMVVFLGTFNMVFMEEDSQFAEKMRLAMGIVDQSLPHLRKGLYSTADMEATADIIYQSTSCAAVMITDAQKILAMKGENWYDVLRDEAVLKPILSSIHDRKPTTFSYAEKTDPLYHILKNHIIVAAPLIEMDKPVGSLTMMVKKHWHTSQSNLDFASELARLFSTPVRAVRPGLSETAPSQSGVQGPSVLGESPLPLQCAEHHFMRVPGESGPGQGTDSNPLLLLPPGPGKRPVHAEPSHRAVPCGQLPGTGAGAV